jgi:hypothetical protein
MNSQYRRPAFDLKHIHFAVLIAMTLIGAKAAETVPKPLFPGIMSVCSCESLKNFLPDTTIESAIIDTNN